MSLWLVRKFYKNDDTQYYEVHPYSFWGHINCCWQWYGIKGLKHAYLSEKKANKVAKKLNYKLQKEKEKNIHA